MNAIEYHAAAFERLARTIEELTVKRSNKAKRLRELGPGRYGNVRVYWVKKAKVKAHTRAEHLAVRVIG